MINRRTFQNKPLTDEEINEVAPSAFAIEPWVAQSERYAFVPTSNVIAGMREAGFQPFSAAQSLSPAPSTKSSSPSTSFASVQITRI